MHMHCSYFSVVVEKTSSKDADLTVALRPSQAPTHRRANPAETQPSFAGQSESESSSRSGRPGARGESSRQRLENSHHPPICCEERSGYEWCCFDFFDFKRALVEPPDLPGKPHAQL